MTVLNILVQNPEVSFDEIVADAVTLATEDDEDDEPASQQAEVTDADKKIDLSIFEF
jgi:hypothetical protein